MEQSAYRNRNSQDLRKKVVGQIGRRGPHTRARLTDGTGISITNASGAATNSAGTGPVSVAYNSVTIANQYSPNSVFCDNGPTEIVDVVNPVTGKTWMDRNLGAQRAAISSTDQQALWICINGVEEVMDINAAIQHYFKSEYFQSTCTR
jgi:hypothetical protein